jgi:catechol 2,3-dioxygenase-like lactoylglutathione lyase family enzyme
MQLHHVNVVVDDLGSAREFYCGLLGLAEIERPDFPTRGLWLAVGDAQVHVAEGDDPAPRRHHFALAVDDLDAAIAHLEGAGIEVRRFPVVEGAGAQAGVRDPSGNLIELRQAE